ncbi:unnamed protein product (macronuclear) [Paramecium tetraurelia]|uniref:Uncharacterized protein n=1 Tax=Paramecium tetraurelia TaxID=5888 RepID=A0EC93_PARTE|nr:uncharacterized protein GSPATT00025647001 [Paramecium tetraurelia]CAK92910.1 unnamed protein product [Paramecium tetraurelia]|eukprot:XP_001460307.1 hypothetical protein (macronuclear) [Paramecium tetraurelia strain d4-2]
MRNSQTTSNLANFSDHQSNLPASSARINKIEIKSSVVKKESRQCTSHVDALQRKSIKVKNLLIITDDQVKQFSILKKLLQNAKESVQSYRSPKHLLKKDEKSLDQESKGKQRVLSPIEQNEVIEYLQRKNEELVQENKQKQQLINRLLGGCNGSQRIKKVQSPKSLMTLKSIPKSAEAEKQMETFFRLPLIKTPEPQLDQKQEVQRRQVENERNESHNLYNMSFGNQINQNEEKKTKEQFELTSNYNGQSSLRIKLHSQPNHPIKKNHFLKFLLKLPQEFHLEMGNQKIQL